MCELNIRFSSKVGFKGYRFHYNNGNIIIPRNPQTLFSDHIEDFVIDNISHETIHFVLEKELGFNECRLLDKIRATRYFKDETGIFLQRRFNKKLYNTC